MSELANVAAEREIICGTLSARGAEQDQLLSGLRPEDFYLPAHESIWWTMQAMHSGGELIDFITIMSGLAKHGYQDLQKHIIELADLGTVAVQAAAYTSGVYDLAVRRRLAAMGTRVVQLAGDAEGSPAELVSVAQTELEAAYKPAEQARTHVSDILPDLLAELRDPTPPQGIAWPYMDADRLLKPMSAGQFVIVAGRPGMGKSVALSDIARHAVLKQHKSAVVFSLEMRAEEYLKRILAAETGIRLTYINEKRLDERQWDALDTAARRLADAPLHIIDKPECTIADVRGRIRELKADIVCMDYLQLGTFNPKVQRREGLEEFSRGLKIAANQFGIPIVAAAQLNRGAQDQKRPRISDLRESGALEQDADVITLLHREDYFERESPRAGELDYIIGKQRNGPTGEFVLSHQLHYTRFSDMAN
ncbi:replicative DNA helicase [Timonella senegalensis]|uniref:replicative DNA helicase n=1 Tax=Timonella senegalensis TaxID=1465825 RepID=UPI0028AA88FD|nr:DnaB-like helicase C-terminal domain-containing protein [Timonella senegalensis]